MTPDLEIRNLSFQYPGGLSALEGINLVVPPGQKTGIVGANGAGKSTLLLHLNGLLRGDGQIFVAGIPVNDANLRRIRSMVGQVFQDPDDQLFCPTVYDDVAFGPLHMGLPEAEVRERVEAALQAVGLNGKAERAPHQLSLGEKKLAAIATVLSMSPRILALDEPTSALDARGRRRIMRVLAERPETQLIVTHDLPLVEELADRMVVLDRGRLVADGKPAELISDRELLVRYGLV